MLLPTLQAAPRSSASTPFAGRADHLVAPDLAASACRKKFPKQVIGLNFPARKALVVVEPDEKIVIAQGRKPVLNEGLKGDGRGNVTFPFPGCMPLSERFVRPEEHNLRVPFAGQAKSPAKSGLQHPHGSRFPRASCETRAICPGTWS